MHKVKAVLFVCTGNSCRSVMAEGLLKKYLKELGKDGVRVTSAGVSAPEALPPALETIDVMKREDIDVSKFESKSVTEKMIKEADLILVMEEFQRDEVLRLVPEASAKTHLLREFGRENKPYYSAVPDPIGRPLKDYEECLKTIKEETERIARLL